jgi:hypothetical protein
MTEQLMENLTNEEHEALLLMSEHAIAPPLSPAAQAVLNGFRAVPTLMDGPSIAGALRAAADQVHHHWDGMECVDYLCAIAAELEGL